ncbi:peptidoglycan bridge formation glycyltransferase FemA/FemB family protein [bacterium]|nr:peptidoglycan bridge formation glycyltransferase FemA/FemB family protein [bacterium]
MEVKEIKDKKTWEDFLLKCEEKTFLQSWNWGEFQKRMGNKIWRLSIFENGGDPISTALVVKIVAKRGKFLFLPHGPVIKSQISNLKSQILEVFLERLKEIAKEEKVDFIRVSPIWERNKENIEIFKKLGFREGPIHMHPEETWQLDIKKPEEELLLQMRKTTRYLIRKAQKNKDIEISKSQDLKDIEIFENLYLTTVKRQHFVPFSLDYLKNELLAFKGDNQISIFLGKYKEEIVCGGIFVFWQNLAFYHHGASLLKYPKIPVSYLLQWEAIKEAKRRDCEFFNFWGIAPEKSPPSHPWAGLTLFKMGFGGERIKYVKTQDLPLSKKYWLNFLIEKIRKKKRRL